MSCPAPPLPMPVRHQAHDGVVIPAYPVRALFAVWAAAALPMAALAWLVAPRLAGSLGGPAPLGEALLFCLTAGLVWQFALVAALVAHEQGTLRWGVIRQALWLQAPRSPRTGRRGGRMWLVLLPLTALFGMVHGTHLLPRPLAPASRDFGSLLASPAGAHLMHGAWGWFALNVTLLVFNTVLGEELLFRGFLLPRSGRLGRSDWLANGVLFALYHLHEPWMIPMTLLDSVILSYSSRRYRSAWIGIAVHSSQSIFLTAALLGLVLRPV